jgi:hypothetical protein
MFCLKIGVTACLALFIVDAFDSLWKSDTCQSPKSFAEIVISVIKPAQNVSVSFSFFARYVVNVAHERKEIFEGTPKFVGPLVSRYAKSPCFNHQKRFSLRLSKPLQIKGDYWLIPNRLQNLSHPHIDKGAKNLRVIPFSIAKHDLWLQSSFSAFCVGYETEKLHRFFAAVFQLMLLVWRNEDGISGFELPFFFSADSNPLSFQYEDLMFPAVSVEGAVSSSFHLE